MAEERRRSRIATTLSSIGASAQAAIPGLYAWAITVAPAAWARGSPLLAKIAAVAGIVALVTAPLVEGAGPVLRAQAPEPNDPRGLAARGSTRSEDRALRAWTGPVWARLWSVWGFVLSSATVWALVPGALSSAKLDAVRGVLGMAGWALFAFASAGPALKSDPEVASRVVAGATLRPRSEVPRGDVFYVMIGVVLAFGLQLVGWGIPVPERAVLVRLVTVVSGIAVLGATTAIALARHAPRAPASRRVRLRRALPWFVVLAVVLGSGLFLVALH